MSVRHFTVLLLVMCCLSAFSVAQGDDEMVVAKASTAKFVNLPGVPTCMTAAVNRGDPSKESSVMFLKFTAGCVVPWHWHTAPEQLLIVNGRGKADMKDGKSMPMNAGDFAYLPAKNIHQFTAVTPVLMYFNPQGPFDIHYLDRDWKEIPAEQALKTSAKKVSTTKSSMKQ